MKKNICQWCGRGSSTEDGHPECRDRIEKIWDRVYIGLTIKGMPDAATVADDAIVSLKGGLARG